MKKSLLFIFTFLLYSVSFSQKISEADYIFIDSLMKSYYPDNLPGAVILASNGDNIVLNKAYGLANVELGVPNKTDNVFCIGSVSKQFAAISILQLVQANKLSLNDNIAKYFPEYDLEKKGITVENILTHTSGIISYTEKQSGTNGVEKPIALKSLIEIFIKDTLIFEPSSDWSYSNSGFALAAAIVEKVSGISYQKYVSDNILKPLQMNSTFFGTNTGIVPKLVSGYYVNDTIVNQEGYIHWSWITGAGDILSSTGDMFKWYKGLISGRIINKELLNKAWTSFTLTNGISANYGLGFAVDDYKGMRIVAHGGSIKGFLTDEVIIPDKDIFVIILSNKQGRLNPKEITTAAALRLAGNPLDILNYKSENANDLNKFTGVYEIHRAGSRLAKNLSSEKMYNYISVKNDTLYIQRSGGGKEPLFNVGENIFAKNNSNTFYEFNFEGKNVKSLEIYSEPINYGPNEVEPITNLALPQEKKAIKLDESYIQKLAGKYNLEGDLIIEIAVEDNKVILKMPGEKDEEIFPETKKKFFFKELDARIEFVIDAGDNVTGFILHQLRDYFCKKI